MILAPPALNRKSGFVCRHLFSPMCISAKIGQDARFIFVEDSSGGLFFIKSDRIKPVSGEDLATEWEAHSKSFLEDA